MGRGQGKKYLICYDICDQKRLRRVHRTLRDYGVPVQQSVFEAQLQTAQLDRLLERLAMTIETTEDKVAFYPLTPDYQKISLGVVDGVVGLMLV